MSHPNRPGGGYHLEVHQGTAVSDARRVKVQGRGGSTGTRVGRRSAAGGVGSGGDTPAEAASESAVGQLANPVAEHAGPSNIGGPTSGRRPTYVESAPWLDSSARP